MSRYVPVLKMKEVNFLSAVSARQNFWPYKFNKCYIPIVSGLGIRAVKKQTEIDAFFGVINLAGEKIFYNK